MPSKIYHASPAECVTTNPDQGSPCAGDGLRERGGHTNRAMYQISWVILRKKRLIKVRLRHDQQYGGHVWYGTTASIGYRPAVEDKSVFEWDLIL